MTMATIMVIERTTLLYRACLDYSLSRELAPQKIIDKSYSGTSTTRSASTSHAPSDKHPHAPSQISNSPSRLPPLAPILAPHVTHATLAHPRFPPLAAAKLPIRGLGEQLPLHAARPGRPFPCSRAAGRCGAAAARRSCREAGSPLWLTSHCCADGKVAARGVGYCRIESRTARGQLVGRYAVPLQRKQQRVLRVGGCCVVPHTVRNTICCYAIKGDQYKCSVLRYRR